jgi:hypothetical protein
VSGALVSTDNHLFFCLVTNEQVNKKHVVECSLVLSTRTYLDKRHGQTVYWNGNIHLLSIEPEFPYRQVWRNDLVFALALDPLAR